MNKTLAKLVPSFILEIIRSQPNLQKMAANTGWLFMDRILKIVAGLFVGVWVMRYLGPEQFGRYSYAIAFVALLAPFSSLGLSGIVVRNIVREPFRKDEILGTASMLRLTSSILLVMVSVAVISLLRSDDNLTRWLVAIISVKMVFQALFTIDSWFQSQVKSKYTVWANASALVLISIAKVILILVQAPLIAFACVMSAEVGLGAIGLIILYHVTGQRLKAWRASLLQAKQLLKDSWPLLASAIAVTIYMKIDQVMLGQMCGDKELGIYSAAVRLSEMWYFIPVAISSSAFPTIVRSREHHPKLVYHKRMQTFYDVMIAIAYIIVIPLVLLALPLANLLLKTDYTGTGAILRVHAWSLLFVFLGLCYGKFLLTENMTRFYMFSTILGAVVNVGLNLWLIPKYAGLGAAWATVIAYASSSYVACLLWKPLWPVFGQLSLALLVPFRLRSLRRSLREIH